MSSSQLLESERIKESIRTYEHRESTWQTTRAERSMAIIKVMKMAEIKDVKKVANRLRAYIPEWRMAVTYEKQYKLIWIL